MGRGQKIDDLLRASLAQLLLREVEDPRVKMATISSVRTTGDLKRATVRVSVLGEDEDRRRCIEALQHAKGFLRRQLASRLHIRRVPELHFELDQGPEHSQRISDILEGLDDTDSRT